MIHRRRSSPLHTVRAAVGAAWCLALAAIALSLEHPLLLAALLAGVLLAGAAARVGRDVVRATSWAMPFGLFIAVVNALVVREGLTVLVHAEVLLLGAVDVTLEALLHGLVLGLRAVVVIACFALYSAAVDPDDLLRGLRRLGMRSGLTAALATRLVPVLAGDARRLRDAQLSRGGVAPSRAAVARAVMVNALDRATDVAATLEIRGYARAGRTVAGVRRPWSRHDTGFGCAGLAMVAGALFVHLAGWDAFEAYPRTVVPLGLREVVVVGALLLLVLAPFTDRRGIRR